MKMLKEQRGPWTVWQGDFAFVGFDVDRRSMVVRNYAGRYIASRHLALGGRSVEDVLDERMRAVCSRYLEKAVDDNFVVELMDDTISLLFGLKEEGLIAELEPLFEHDCDDCLFLGRSSSNKHDLYFCEKPSGPFPQIIARYGAESSQSKSGLIIALSGHDVELLEGIWYAARCGLFLGREHVLQRLGSREQVEVLMAASI